MNRETKEKNKKNIAGYIFLGIGVVAIVWYGGALAVVGIVFGYLIGIATVKYNRMVQLTIGLYDRDAFLRSMPEDDDEETTSE